MPDSFDSILAECIERLECGDRTSVEKIIDDHPQHADELSEFFQNQNWFGATKPTEAADCSGQVWGDYTLIRPLARGGMGVVYLARQNRLDRLVALKTIVDGRLADPEMRSRFRTEAAAAASLDHPGIVPVYEVGTHDGHHYFAMRYVDGTTLATTITGGGIDPRRAAQLVRDIAAAVCHAHEHHVIHRDLKPENILVDRDGHLMVSDFGLASVTTDHSSMTCTGQVLGTPHYMSPQQASGLMHADQRSDIYSMGAILYALLSGHPPHRGDSLAEVLRSALQDQPLPIRVAARHVPPSLSRICDSALAFEPAARYQTGCDLLADLDRFLGDEPVRGQDTNLMRRMFEELDRDQHQTHFVDWSAAIYQIGIIVAVSHIVIYLLQLAHQPQWIAYWTPRLIMLTLIAGRIVYARGGSVWPRTVAERPVWSIWIAYITTLGFTNLMALFGIVPVGALFPLTSVLSAFGFIAMAGHAWGASGLLGLGFLAIAAICCWLPTTASLWFGAMWLLSLAMLAHHYDRRQSG